MEHNKEHLQALLDFIDKLCDEPENEWFRQELAARFQESGSTVSNSVYDEKVEKIEKYLALDYQLDEADSMIDYSFIADTHIRETLERDNREMMRYWGGLRAHKVDFFEYCRYACLQVELLLNFFYNKLYEADPIGTINRIKNNYLSTVRKEDARLNTEAFFNKEKLSITDIHLSYKISAFCHEFEVKPYQKRNIDYIREIRNTVSHRNPYAKDDMFELEFELRKNNFFKTDSPNEIDWGKFRYMDQQTRDNANRYQFLYFIDCEPFGDVHNALYAIANTIKEEFTIYWNNESDI